MFVRTCGLLLLAVLADAKSCKVTKNLTKTVQSTTTETTGTFTVASDANFINGDDFPQRLGTLTVTITDASTSTVLGETITVTTTSTPTSKIGTDVTVTLPTPSGFLPIKSTLPSATLGISQNLEKRDYVAATKKKCKTVTKRHTTTRVKTQLVTTTTTLTGNVIIFPEEGTAFEYDSFTFPTVYTSISTTVTETGTSTVTQTSTAPTTTVSATTTTVHAACETDNYASGVKLSFTDQPAPFVSSDYDAILPGEYLTARSCCEASFPSAASTWIWYVPAKTCLITYGTGLDCPIGQRNATALYDTLSTRGDIILIGNSYCGKYTIASSQV